MPYPYEIKPRTVVTLFSQTIKGTFWHKDFQLQTSPKPEIRFQEIILHRMCYLGNKISTILARQQYYSIDNVHFWARFLSLKRSKLRLCSANHRAAYFSNLTCDLLSIVRAYSEQESTCLWVEQSGSQRKNSQRKNRPRWRPLIMWLPHTGPEQRGAGLQLKTTNSAWLIIS